MVARELEIDLGGGPLRFAVDAARQGRAEPTEQLAQMAVSTALMMSRFDPERLDKLREVYALIRPRSRWARQAPRTQAEREQCIEELDSAFDGAFQLGTLKVTKKEPLWFEAPYEEPKVSPELAPPAAAEPGPDQEPVHFEVRLVDELGEGISGVALRFSHAGKQEKKITDGSGMATYDAVGPSFATVSVEDLAALRDAVKPRWDAPRQTPHTDWLKVEGGTQKVFSLTDRLDVSSERLQAEQPKTLSFQPPVRLVRIRGAFFDTNKCFLLPTVLPYVKKLKGIYDQHPNSPLVIVGHTDVTGEPHVNDPLSLDRARAFEAFIKDDVDAWLAWFESSKPDEQRWSTSEDKLMLRSLPDYPEKPRDEDRVRWFQRARGLSVDGVAGPVTRRQLVTEYMGHDGTTLPEGTQTLVHGCGESFPMPEPPPEEQSASDRHSDSEHRRVELFLFDPELGVQPPLPGETAAPGSLDYPEWFARSAVITDLEAGGVSKEVTILEMHDALFRTNSCVLMPEGEDPMTRPRAGAVGAAQTGTGEHLSLTSVGLVASVLRYNEEHSGKKLLVAGHCDTTGTIDFNQTLSEERAGMALARLMGDRDAFEQLADGRCKVADYKQILSWVTLALAPEKLTVPFDCEPRAIDDDGGTDTDRVEAFQEQYNQNKSALGASGPDLSVDGDVGPLTWGAFFDCYEFALREELGEEAAGVQALRDQLLWVAPDRTALGFSEHHPVDNLGRNGYRSQANRRVEVLFFDEGEEPDLDLGDGDPEMSDVYLPGHYQRDHLDPMLSARRHALRVRLLDARFEPLDGVDWLAEFDGDTRDGTTASDGLAVINVPPGTSSLRLTYGEVSLDLNVTDMPSIETAEGIRQRLENLGYRPAAAGGAWSPETANAVRCFQLDQGIEPVDTANASEVDDATQDTLVERFGH